MPTLIQPVPTRAQANSSGSLWPVYLGFAATGVGVALPGVVLPLLLTRWQLKDSGGGTLFLLAWIGSSLGALLVSGAPARAIAAGSAVVAFAALGMNFASAGLAFPCMGLYGLGLGVTMTAASLLLQRRAGESGRAEDTSRALVRLNLAWALGACFCPVLALRVLKSGDLRPLLFSVAGCFVLLSVWALLQQTSLAASTGTGTGQSAGVGAFLRAMPPVLILLIMLGTGVEASAGGWLATYANRGGGAVSQVVAAPTCFWAGLLLSRLFWSFAGGAERWALRGSLLLVAISSMALLETRPGWPFLLAALCLGFGIGPVYPLLLARALRFHSSGIIFFLAGVGSACLPWVTGFVSTERGSLHAGLFVPAMAAAGMFLLSFRIGIAGTVLRNDPAQ